MVVWRSIPARSTNRPTSTELGLTSHASVDVMLALEELSLDHRVPDEVLFESTFLRRSVHNIAQVIESFVDGGMDVTMPGEVDGHRDSLATLSDRSCAKFSRRTK